MHEFTHKGNAIFNEYANLWAYFRKKVLLGDSETVFLSAVGIQNDDIRKY